MPPGTAFYLTQQLLVTASLESNMCIVAALTDSAKHLGKCTSSCCPFPG
jgi:hypothetical protein